MRYRTLLSVLILLVASACARDGRRHSPNVVIACVDALRRDHVGVYGARNGATPHLDRLAREAVVFDQATSVASWTKPAVVSLLTGLYPSQHQVLRKSRAAVDVLPGEVVTLAERLRGAGYHTGAFVENDHLKARYSGLDQGFEHYVEGAGAGPMVADRFLSWLEGLEREPFLAYLHFLDAHWPYVPAAPIPGREAGVRQQLSIAHWGIYGPHWWLLRERVNEGRLALDAEGRGILAGLYDAEIFAVDAVLGRVVEFLRHGGILDRSVLVVTADHGEGFLEHGRLDHGYGPYEELVRVPLIIRFPEGRYGGRRIEDQVQLVDVVPTVLDYTGHEVGTSLGGRSLVPLLRGAAGARMRPALTEEHFGNTRVTSLRTSAYKYVRREHLQPPRQPSPVTVPSELQSGVRVEIGGIFAGGEVIAGRVKWRPAGDVDDEIEGPIATVDREARSVRILDYEISLQSKSRWRDASGEFGTKDLEPLQWVRVDGLVSGRNMRARKLKRIFDSSRREVRLEGLVGRVGATGGEAWLELCGRQVRVDPKAKWDRFRGDRRVLGAGLAGAAHQPPAAEELYDLRVDPKEKHDIAGEQPPALARLRRLQEMRQRLAAAAAPGARAVELDKTTRERLRALGYVEE